MLYNNATLKEVLALPMGTYFSVPVMIKALEIKAKRASVGGNYLFITVQDSTDTTSFPFWEKVEVIYENFKPGDVVELKGTVTEYHQQIQLSVNAFSRAPKDLYPSSRFIQTYPVEKAAQYLKTLIFSFDPPWNDLAKCAFTFPPYGNEEVWEKFLTAPAAMTNHQSKIGGLCVHTAGVVRNAVAIHNLYRSGASFLPGDLEIVTIDQLVDINHIMFCALMHDYGKLYDYIWGTVIEWNPETLVSHVYDNVAHVDRINRECGEPLTRENLQKVKYTLLSHHGPYGENKPKTLEDWIVSIADLIDGKVYTAFEGKMPEAGR